GLFLFVLKRSHGEPDAPTWAARRIAVRIPVLPPHGVRVARAHAPPLVLRRVGRDRNTAQAARTRPVENHRGLIHAHGLIRAYVAGCCASRCRTSMRKPTASSTSKSR